MDRMARIPLWAWALATALLALVVRAPLLSGPYDLTYNPDGPLYLAIAHGFLHGQDAVGAVGAGQYRVPGYPALVAVAEILPGSTVSAVLLVQHLIACALAGAVVLVGGRLVGAIPAVTAAAMLAIHPLMISAEHDVLPDFAFAVVLFAATALLAFACTRDPLDWRLLAAAGAAFGLAAYVKPTAQVAVLVGIAPLALATHSVRKTLWGTGIIAVTALAVMAPWVVRNLALHGDAVMTIQGGEALFYRVFDQDRNPVPTDRPYGPVAAAAHEKAVAGVPEGVFTDSYSAVSTALAADGLADDELRDVEKDLAMTAIWRDPLGYAGGTLSNMRRQAVQVDDFGNSLAAAERKLADADSPLPHALATAPWWAAGKIAKVWLILTLGGLTALVAIGWGPRDRRVHAVTFTWTWLLVAGATALSSAPLERFAAQGALLLWLPAAAGTTYLASRAIATLVARRTIRSSR
jgi:4-amino-4-deoxy-L-arabinose transferase-like glycosyltransferase